MAPLWLEPKLTLGPDDEDRIPAGEIPQVAETWKFMNAAYPIMNEHQLAIGETTTGGKRGLRSRAGIIDAPELYRLLLERATTAREAIRIRGDLAAGDADGHAHQARHDAGCDLVFLGHLAGGGAAGWKSHADRIGLHEVGVRI